MDAERFVARDTKCALEKVKAKLGADALILSTNRSDLGIEISAVSGESFKKSVSQADMAPSRESVNDITLGYLDRELRALRHVLYTALGERTWQEVAGKKPVSSALEQRLRTLGLCKLAIANITSDIDTSSGLNIAWSAVLRRLEAAIEPENKAAIAINVVPKAIIGGSASCRSLICQQLVRKELQTSKSSEVLVISVTSDPSGALVDFCKREKVKRIHIPNVAEAQTYIRRARGRKKIVIETEDLTPGLGTNDPVLKLVKDQKLDIDAILVIPATYQSDVIRTTSLHTMDLPIAGAIISRTSEAVSLGAVLDAVILNGTPIIGLSHQLESCVRSVTSSELISLAKKLARKMVAASERFSERSGYAQTA